MPLFDVLIHMSVIGSRVLEFGVSSHLQYSIVTTQATASFLAVTRTGPS